ncbi:radical SAM protein [Neptuniibacter sp. CAU 1671]|uniref:radical SAM protein n=1 Tax=Neptuniibacter sp. CAU 1671 TaxID=3032593 RepID=UPI0023D97CA3|nr:radical SAM protein [Neptuniibacter sp. CAU 1671]MDF2180500.1 radical SAM protein [Neptuniibacter sp. CAU 1671]
MIGYPLNYIEPVFRPPSEAGSLILQVTNGCSWNKCTFCEMYTAPQKKFSIKQQSEIEAELQRCAARLGTIRRVFLADGDAMALSFTRLENILLAIRAILPDVTRISSYCLPRNLKNKSIEQLKHLQELGLELLYIGAESGDDQVLAYVNKGETFATTAEAFAKSHAAGMKTSMIIINGLGGVALSEQHARASARLANLAQPNYLATLVLFFSGSQQRLKSGFDHGFQPLNQQQLFQEMEWFLSDLELEKTIFRSDHASNYLVLKGVLNKDKNRLLDQVRSALTGDKQIYLRDETDRGL